MSTPKKHTPQSWPTKARISEAEIILRRLLKTSPQALWLDTIRRTKRGQHNSLIQWMLSQTACDFAVAAHAFYRSDPAAFLDDPKPLPARPATDEILAQVLLNWDTGSYRIHNLLVEPVDAQPRAIARLNQKVMARPRGSLPFTIPERFLHPQGGNPASLPTHLVPADSHHLWPIYQELGLDVPDTPPGLKRRMAQIKGVFQKGRPTNKVA